MQKSRCKTGNKKNIKLKSDWFIAVLNITTNSLITDLQVESHQRSDQCTIPNYTSIYDNGSL